MILGRARQPSLREQRQRLRKQWIERLKAKAFIRLFQAT